MPTLNHINQAVHEENPELTMEAVEGRYFIYDSDSESMYPTGIKTEEGLDQMTVPEWVMEVCQIVRNASQK